MIIFVCVAVRTQMAAGGKLTKSWWSRWLRWRRGFHQTNAAAAKPAPSRHCIMLSTVSNKCKVTKLHAKCICNWFFFWRLFVMMLSCFSEAFMFMWSSAANSEYYNLLMQNGQDERRDASVFTLEELERVTSEHSLKNTVNICEEKRNSHQLHINYIPIHYLKFFGLLKYSWSLSAIQKSPKPPFAYVHVFIFVWSFGVRVSVCVFIALAFVACLPVFLYTSVYVGLLCGGFLAVKRPRDVRLRAGSKPPVLQEEIPGIIQVCGAALPPRCECVLLTHGSAASATLE